jgi:hypothetical protein
MEVVLKMKNKYTLEQHVCEGIEKYGHFTKKNDSAATFENASNGMPLGNENLSLG